MLRVFCIATLYGRSGSAAVVALGLEELAKYFDNKPRKRSR